MAAAARSCFRPNVRFAVAAADRLPVSDGSYDVYVSFETIEHVQDDLGLLADQRTCCVRRIADYLTPNRELLDPGTRLEDKTI